MSTSPSLPPPLPPAVLSYASPTSPATAHVGVWRDNAILVAADGAVFPPRCVKCGEPVDGASPLRRTYYWHHPAYFLLVLVAILIYAIVAIIVRKKGTVTFCLCARHRARRRNAILLAWLLVPGGIAAMIAGGVNNSAVTALAGVVALIAGIVAVPFVQPLKPARIDNGYLYLKGASPAFLADLPGVVRQ